MSEDSLNAIVGVKFEVLKEREKPQLVSLLFFDYANQTKNDKINLLGIFDRVLVDAETKKTHPIGVFIRTGMVLEGMVSVFIFSPNGDVVSGFGYDIDSEKVPNKDAFQSQILVTTEFEVTEEGLYWFQVIYKQQLLGGASLLIEYRKGEEADEHTSGDT